MKPDIHPEYRDVLFHDTGADTYFLVGSTIATTRTAEYEGHTYPYVPIDISSASHPVYTGKHRVRQNDGRIAKFNKRFAQKPTS
ncbi:MAG: type B 50S ribosomal protein L31 [Pseudomonadota bacterium]